MFNRAYYKRLAAAVKSVYSKFGEKEFLVTVTKGLDELSLNERLRNTSRVLKLYLPNDYLKALEILTRVVERAPGGYTALVFPDFVAQYGLQEFQASLKALRYFTVFGSSEFAIRVFLKSDFEHTLAEMRKWSKDTNHHVRRLASEGSRPRLPWSFKLDKLIDDPSLTADILRQLNRDQELYVRKSVANHLNDISKDNAAYLLKELSTWDRSHESTAWIVKHATRSLIKKGDPSTLKLLNFEKNAACEIKNFVCSKSLKLGQRLELSFELSSEKRKSQNLVVDYRIHYVKQNGQTSAKVFKLKNVVLKPNETLQLKTSQQMKDFTTRKHYPGKHAVEVLVNGEVKASASFLLKV